MLASISPVGDTARRQRWPITAVAYLLASAAGGAMTGAVLGIVGEGLRTTLPVVARTEIALALLGLVALAGVAIDLDAVPLRLPTWRRQVDERWLGTYRGWVYGAGFGFQLGLGVVTIIPAAVTHAALAAAVLAGSVPAAVAVGATFGVVRALPLLATTRVRTAPRLLRLSHWLDRAARPAEVAATATLGLIGLVALTGAVAW